MAEQDSIDMFFDDDQSQKKDAYRTNKQFKKARRKMVTALLSAFLIVAIPYFRGRYTDFNSLYSTTLGDFRLFQAFVPQGMHSLFARVPVFLVLIAFVFLFALVMFVKMRRLNSDTLPAAFDDFKRIYNRFDILVFILHLMALYMIANAFFFSVAAVEGRSMEPTFNTGDNVVMVHFDESFNRFDLVVIRPEIDHEEFLIKRLIGLPGETVRIDEDGVFVNGMRLDEPHLVEGTETVCPQVGGKNGETCSWTLQDDEYFVLGDNRSNSLDSRKLGAFSKTQLYGRVQYRLFPFDEVGKVK